MKQEIEKLITQAKWDLQDMKKSEMKISERIKYEKAIVRLEIAQSLLSKMKEA